MTKTAFNEFDPRDLVYLTRKAAEIDEVACVLKITPQEIAGGLILLERVLGTMQTAGRSDEESLRRPGTRNHRHPS